MCVYYSSVLMYVYKYIYIYVCTDVYSIYILFIDLSHSVLFPGGGANLYDSGYYDVAEMVYELAIKVTISVTTSCNLCTHIQYTP